MTNIFDGVKDSSSRVWWMSLTQKEKCDMRKQYNFDYYDGVSFDELDYMYIQEEIKKKAKLIFNK